MKFFSEDTQNDVNNFYKNPDTDPRTGLSDKEVADRIEWGLYNNAPENSEISLSKIVTKNIFTYFNLLFFIFAIALILQGSFNHLAFLGVVLSNTVIGIFQEYRSKKLLEKLTFESAPFTDVVRNGKVLSVHAEELVLDDIVILKSGCRIPADAVVSDGEVSVNESLLTGEADEIKKSKDDTLLSGSFVVSGKCRAQLTAVGDDSFISKLNYEAKKSKRRTRPEMMRSLNILIIFIGVLIIPFSAIMFINQHITLGLSVKESVENTVASSLGMIPEGLYLLTSIALAASTIRLVKQNTLVHDMKCIESLARVDVLCVDKTGTITEPDMKVISIIPQDNCFEQKNLYGLVSSMDSDNVTSAAIKEYFSNTVFVSLPNPIRKQEFSSVTKFCAAEFENDSAYILGAPEILLRDNIESYSKILDEHLSAGERVLLFGKSKNKTQTDAVFSTGTLTDSVEPLAFITLANPIRENAAETFKYFSDNNVEIKVISGDNPKTVSAVASRAGIKNASKYIDMTDVTDEEIKSGKLLNFTVFGRVTPDQKRMLVRRLKRAHHTVAMTGDGVNDILAMKDADCSIAMASGSSAAANVADMVLVNSDFANMPNVVGEGRRVINNIERAASLFLVKNIFSFIMTLISLIAVSYYPLKPVQISLVSGLMIGIPSFFLALEPNKNIVKGRFLTNVLMKSFPSAIAASLLTELWLLIASSFRVGYEEVSTVSCLIYAFASYLMLFKTCKPFNALRGTLYGIMGILFIVCVIYFNSFFSLSRLSIGSAVIMVLLFLPLYPVQLIIEKLTSKLSQS